MDERKIRSEYKKLFDDIQASDQLRLKVLSQKPQKKSIRPVINIAGSIAAAVMIFSAAGNYTFETDKNGIISETFVSQTEEPSFNMRAEQQNETETNDEASDSEQQAEAGSELPSAKPAAAQTAENKGGGTSSKDTVSSSDAGSAVGESAGQKESIGSGQTYHEQETGTFTFEIDEDQKADVVQTPAPKENSDAAPEVNSFSTEKEYSEDENTAEITAPVLRGTRGVGGTTLRINSSSVLSMIPQGASAMSASEFIDEGIYHQEEWDNNRYFDYIGSDILGKIVLPADVGYTGEDTVFFMVDQDGVPQNDTRIFAFSGGQRRVNIITSSDTAYAETYLSYPGLEISDISGNQAVIFNTDDTYKCYMIYNGTSYIIDTVQLTEDELAQLLVSISE